MPPFYLLVRIAFFQNVRRTLSLLHQYCPHLVADNGGEYFGVEFFAGTPAQFDRPCLAHCKPLYDIDYSPLLAAVTPFAIMEGGRCVGKGRVEMVVGGNGVLCRLLFAI